MAPRIGSCQLAEIRRSIIPPSLLALSQGPWDPDPFWFWFFPCHSFGSIAKPDPNSIFFQFKNSGGRQKDSSNTTQRKCAGCHQLPMARSNRHGGQKLKIG